MEEGRSPPPHSHPLSFVPAYFSLQSCLLIIRHYIQLKWGGIIIHFAKRFWPSVLQVTTVFSLFLSHVGQTRRLTAKPILHNTFTHFSSHLATSTILPFLPSFHHFSTHFTIFITFTMFGHFSQLFSIS